MNESASYEVIPLKIHSTREIDPLELVAAQLLRAAQPDFSNVLDRIDYHPEHAGVQVQQARWTYASPETPNNPDILAITHIDNALIIAVRAMRKSGESHREDLTYMAVNDHGETRVTVDRKDRTRAVSDEAGSIKTEDYREFSSLFYDAIAVHGLDHFLLEERPAA